MLTDTNFQDLEVKGYTVVKNVLTSEECDKTIGQYKDWLSQFQEGDWPFSVNSLIRGYNVGQLHPSWFVRLKCKQVFAEVWNTDKLLSSFDTVAIGRPPENGEEEFQTPGCHWLHFDQGSQREGLHAYQGSVYLEDADEDDWTLHVMEGSHLHFQSFMNNNLRASIRSEKNDFYRLRGEEVDYFKDLGCDVKRVAVPKGAVVLWDSRLVHANANPVEGRKHPGRWRYCVFVSMTPAVWASRETKQQRKEAYENAHMSTHWSSQGFKSFEAISTSFDDENEVGELPDIAKSTEAKLLSGALPYDFKDGYPNGEAFRPRWRRGAESPKLSVTKKTLKTAVVCALTLGVSLVGYYCISNLNQ